MMTSRAAAMVSAAARTLSVLLAATALGCGSDEPSPGSPGDDPQPGFVADPETTGARIWIDARLGTGGEALLELWAAELGPVFGYSLHVRYDGEHLAPDATTVEQALGADPDEAVYASNAIPSDVALGGTRRSPVLGEVELGGPTLLGTSRLLVTGAKTSRLSLERVVARRADGGYVTLTALGGELTTGGAP